MAPFTQREKTTMKSILNDIKSILAAATPEGGIKNFSDEAWNSRNTTSILIQDMEDNYLINIVRAKDKSILGITIASTGIYLLRCLEIKSISSMLLAQANNQEAPPSVSYIVEAVQRIAEEMDIQI